LIVSVVFSQVALIFVRLIGLGVAIDYLINIKRKRFQAQVAGWSIWTLASFSQLLTQFVTDTTIIEVLDFLFAISTLLGSFLLSISVIVYFRHVSVKPIFLVTMVLIIVPFLLYYFLGVNLAVNLTVSFSFIIIGGLFVIGMIEKKNFQQEVGESVKWFYVLIWTGALLMIIYIGFSLTGINLAAYSSEIESEVAIIVVNSFALALMVLILVLLIHMENSRSSLYNYKLKDKYSHNLGNLVQVMVSAIHIIEQGGVQKSERERIVDLLNQKSQEVSDLIHEIRTLE
jgi:hypothetical protein